MSNFLPKNLGRKYMMFLAFRAQIHIYKKSANSSINSLPIISGNSPKMLSVMKQSIGVRNEPPLLIR